MPHLLRCCSASSRPACGGLLGGLPQQAVGLEPDEQRSRAYWRIRTKRLGVRDVVERHELADGP